MIVRTICVAAVVTLVSAPTAEAYPQLIGGNGLTPNASALASYIMNNYPGVQSIGGVRPDRLPDHPNGLAIDIMIGNNMGLGDTIAADIRNRSGIKYMLWRVPQHFNHIHVTVR